MAQLKILFWLKWKLTFAGFLRQKLLILGLVLTILFLVPFSLGISAGIYFGFFKLSPRLDREFLHALLGLFYFAGALMWMLGYGLSESHDLSKLFLFPISHKRLFLWGVLDGIIDLPTILLFPSLLAITLGLSKNFIIGFVVFLLLLIFLFHTVSLGQCLSLLGHRLLHSRRFKDLAIIFASLVGLGFYFIYQIVIRKMVVSYGPRMDFWRFLKTKPSIYLKYLPSGFTAESISSLLKGELELALLFFFLLGAFSLLIFQLSSHLFKRLYMGEFEVSAAAVPSVRRGIERPVTRKHGLKSYIFRWLPGELEAVFDKEGAYLWREPYMKSNLLGVLWMPIFVFGSMVVAGRPLNSVILPIVIAPALLYGESFIGFNIFGWDAKGLNILFSFPCRRRFVFLGKNIFWWLLLAAINFIVLSACCWVAKDFRFLVPLFLLLQGGLLVVMGVGNLLSIYFPMYYRYTKGYRPSQTSSPKRFFFGFVYMFGWAVSMMVSGPLALALLPLVFKLPFFLLFTIPLGLIYAVGVYYGLLLLGESLLQKRELQMLEELNQQVS